MATKKKLLQASAGAAGGAEALSVEDVFSTYLYDGNSDINAVSNGIKLGQANDGYSVYLDGSGDGVVGAVQPDLTDFTAEGWVYFTDLGSNRTIVTLGNSDIQLYYRSSSSNMAIYDTSAKTYSFTPSTHTWYHFALVRDSSDNSVELFIDGVSKGTTTSSAVVSGSLIVGGWGTSIVDPMKGFVSNVRLSDTIRYSSNFTAPTSALTSDSDTLLLILQDKYFIDNSSNNKDVYPIGDANIQGASPFSSSDPGEGGLVWSKVRDRDYRSHILCDTVRGVNKKLSTNESQGEQTISNVFVDEFNSNGYTFRGGGDANESGYKQVSWTFRNAPKFFNVTATWTGDGTSSQTISHDLGSVPGAIFVKCISTTDNWRVYHRSMGNTDMMALDSEGVAFSSVNHWNNTSPTSTEFTVGANANVSGRTYIAYVFAHNDGDGEFGPTEDQDIIKCGTYSGNGISNGPEIDLGFEPQWLLIKSKSGVNAPWLIYDTMRGITNGYVDVKLKNDNLSEDNTQNLVEVNPTGFKITNSENEINNDNSTFIYIAIRKGPMAVPENALDVFAQDLRTANGYISNFPVDMFIHTTDKNTTHNYYLYDRFRPNQLDTTSTAAENSGSQTAIGWFGHRDRIAQTGVNNQRIAWMWRRAPNYFDIVHYTGTGSTHNISHNLGVAPEMMWVKKRNNTGNWEVYFDTGVPSTNNGLGLLRLNNTAADLNGTYMWGNTHPTDSVFTVGTVSGVNNSLDDYVAYLFASLDGVSKVGLYTGNGSSQTIDCGFSNGARFVMIKRTDDVSNWAVFDTQRGIVTGNDPLLSLNLTSAESTGLDVVDPASSGFIVNDIGTYFNESGGTYLFYAIA